MLRSLRRNKVINALFRGVLKGFSKKTSGAIDFLIKRWPPSGVIDCKFNEINFKLYTEGDDGLVHYFYYEAHYQEENDLKLFLELAKRSSTIIDIGANTGLFSILSSKVNTKAKIHAIEPYVVNANRLKKNLELNKCRNVIPYEVAMGESNGTIEFSVPENGRVTDVSSVNGEFSHKIYPELNWVKKIVPVMTLDDFTNQHHITADLIKCDVETFEMSVFNGAKNVLKEQRPTVIFECFLDDERKNFFNKVLADNNYYVYIIYQNGIVHFSEGFTENPDGLNYLITPVVPTKTYISFNNMDEIANSVLLRPSRS